VLKSTVPPGTTVSLRERFGRNLIFSPEYFGEGSHSSKDWDDHTGVPFTILGGDPDVTAQVEAVIREIYPEPHEIFRCGSTEAELTKYMENSYLAVKVGFVNEFYELAQALGISWDDTRYGWLLDPRIGDSHTTVFPDNRGWGGRCLPKDTAAITSFADTIGISLDLMKGVIAANDELRSRRPHLP
jgi:UDPglucose 6-dehydrogenase